MSKITGDQHGDKELWLSVNKVVKVHLLTHLFTFWQPLLLLFGTIAFWH